MTGRIAHFRVARLGLWILILASVAVGAVWLRSNANRNITSKGLLLVPEEALDFGDVWAQPNFQWTLPIQNPTGGDVEIVEFRSSCGCSSIQPEKLLIPAGRTMLVRVALDLTTRDPQQLGLRSRAFATEIVPVIKSGLPSQVHWRLRGRVRPYPIVLSPTRVDFGESLVRGSSFPSRTVEVKCSEALASLVAECDESLARARVVQPIQAGSCLHLEITPRTNLPAGEHAFKVKLKPVLRATAAGSALPPLMLEVSAEVCNDVYVAPSTLWFGAAKVGEILEDTVTLGSREKRFAVVEVKHQGGDPVRVEPAREAGENLHVFRVVQRVANVGAQQGRVEFLVREEGESQPYGVWLSLFYHGLAE